MSTPDIAALLERIAQLELRVASLEARPFPTPLTPFAPLPAQPWPPNIMCAAAAVPAPIIVGIAAAGPRTEHQLYGPVGGGA